MLRSLLLKKTLAYGNAALAVVLAVYIVARVTEMPRTHVAALSVDQPAADSSAIQIDGIPKRGIYNPIVTSGIFGKNANGKPRQKAADKPKQAPPPQPKKEVVTALPLKLIGTVVAAEDDPAGSAIIENRSGAPVKNTFFVGDEVMDGVILKTIRRRMVVLDNTSANRLEQLYLEDDEQNFRAVSRAGTVRPRADVIAERRNLAARIRANRPAVEGANRIFTFSRAELIDEIKANYDELASNIDVRVVKDADGNVQGVQASNLSKTPLAKRFGIEDGDIVQSVNGEQVDSLDRVFDILDQNQSSSTFRVQLLRGGRPQIFTYHLR